MTQNLKNYLTYLVSVVVFTMIASNHAWSASATTNSTVSFTVNDPYCASFSTVTSAGNITMTCTAPASGSGGGGGSTTTAPVCSLIVSPNPITLGSSATLTANCTQSPTSYIWSANTNAAAGDGLRRPAVNPPCTL